MPPKSQTYPGVSATRRRTRMKTNAGGVDHLREMRIRRNRKKRNALNLKFLCGAEARRKISIGGIHERTAVTVAASSGQKEVLRVLLSENIKPDKKPSTEVPYYLLPEKKPWNKQEPWKNGNRIAW